jgi:WD40 repeat protein
MSNRVFLSYARGDDEPFVKRLFADLKTAGFTVWFDRESLLSRGLTFHQEIKDAIRTQVDRLIYISGPRAAQSPYVREEWQFALECDHVVVTPILRIGDYNEVPGEISLLHCEDFRDDAKYRNSLGKLIESLRKPNPKLGGLFAVPNLPAHFLARPELMRRVRDALLVDLQTPKVITSADARVGVQGMGGIGKSVLAAALARNREVRQAYPDGIVWIAFGQHMGDEELLQRQRDLAKHLGGNDPFTSLAQGTAQLREQLKSKAVLIVLDDVWRAADTAAFDVLGPRSRILITTRDAGILHSVHGDLVPVSLFTEAESLQFLADSINKAPAELPSEAHEVARECEYLPLALALSAGMAKKRKGDFHSVLERLRRADLEKIADRESINEQHRSIWRAMQASVEMLSEEELQRFAELAVFDTDATVPEAAAATLWLHTGGLNDLDTEDLLVNLFERSLIQLNSNPDADGITVRRFRLHDLLHDFAVRMSAEPIALHEKLLSAYCAKCPEGWPSGPNDGYFMQHLVGHLVAADRLNDAASLLLDYKWLEAKLNATTVDELIADYDFVSASRVQRLVQDALRLSSHILRHEPNLLAGQLRGRLLGLDEPEIQSFIDSARPSRAAPWLNPKTPCLTAAGGHLVRSLQGHTNNVTGVAITPDGQFAVSGSRDNTLKMWELATGEQVRSLEGHTEDIYCVAITPDGQFAVSGSFDRTLKVWEIATGEQVRSMQGHTGGVHCIGITPDGRFAVSGSRDETLKVWELATGKEVRSMQGHTEWVRCVGITPDGHFAVSGSDDNTVKVWELATGDEVRCLEGHAEKVTGVAITPNGRFAVSGSMDKTLKVWELATGKEVRSAQGPTNWVTCVGITPDGRFVLSGSMDKTLKVWELATGKEVQSLEGHTSWVNCVAISSDGRFAVSGSDDKTLQVWELSKEWKHANGTETGSFQGKMGEVTCVAITPDGRFAVSGSRDKILKVWELATGKEVRSMQGHTEEIACVRITPDGQFAVSGSWDNTLKVWELATGKEVRSMQGHESGVICVAITPDGRFAVSGASYGDKTLEMWDLITGNAVQKMEGHKDIVTCLAITPDGRFAVSGSQDETLKVWELATGKEVRSMQGHTDDMRSVVITSDGRYAVLGFMDTLKVWELATGKEVRSMHGPRDTGLIVIAPDGRFAVSQSDEKTLMVWELATGQLLGSFAFDGDIMYCAITPDGKGIAVGVGNAVVGLDLEGFTR